MDVLDLMEKLHTMAAKDPGLRERLLASRLESDPLSAFCREARACGVELYPMDVVAAGEDFYASIRRSTNGGGENSPMIAGGDDLYASFLTELEHL